MGKAGTCVARTVKSGSAMVMTAPIKKPAPMRKGKLRFCVMRAPTISPMGVMEISEPSVKSAMPKMSTTALRTNSSKVGPFRGVMVKASASTISAMGATDNTASLSLVPMALSNGNTSHLQFFICYYNIPAWAWSTARGKYMRSKQFKRA